MAAKKKIIIPDGCVGCEDEPAPKGQLGVNCKHWIYYHEGQTTKEKERYIGRVRKAANRISGLMFAGKKNKKVA